MEPFEFGSSIEHFYKAIFLLINQPIKKLKNKLICYVIHIIHISILTDSMDYPSWLPDILMLYFQNKSGLQTIIQMLKDHTIHFDQIRSAIFSEKTYPQIQSLYDNTNLRNNFIQYFGDELSEDEKLKICPQQVIVTEENLRDTPHLLFGSHEEFVQYLEDNPDDLRHFYEMYCSNNEKAPHERTIYNVKNVALVYEKIIMNNISSLSAKELLCIYAYYQSVSFPHAKGLVYGRTIASFLSEKCVMILKDEVTSRPDFAENLKEVFLMHALPPLFVAEFIEYLPTLNEEESLMLLIGIGCGRIGTCGSHAIHEGSGYFNTDDGFVTFDVSSVINQNVLSYYPWLKMYFLPCDLEYIFCQDYDPIPTCTDNQFVQFIADIIHDYNQNDASYNELIDFYKKYGYICLQMKSSMTLSNETVHKKMKIINHLK